MSANSLTYSSISTETLSGAVDGNCIVPENEAMRRKLDAAIRDAGTKILPQVVDRGVPVPAAGAHRQSITT